MDHQNHSHSHDSDHNHQSSKYTLADFLPLIVLFVLIFLFVTVRQFFIEGFDLELAMRDFMAAFFILFSGMKLLNLKGFVSAFQIYDIVAKRSRAYAFIYPFIELTLGIFYLFALFQVFTNITTILVMSIGIIGVTKELLKGNTIQCACLGVVFKVPMTWVTFIENAAMILMAIAMLLRIL